MSALANILEKFRTAAVTEREKGTYFEKLVKVYLRQEPFYADLYAERSGFGRTGARSGRPVETPIQG